MASQSDRSQPSLWALDDSQMKSAVRFDKRFCGVCVGLNQEYRATTEVTFTTAVRADINIQCEM